MDNEKEERERRVFGMFAQSSGILTSKSKIESRLPPEPDILFTTFRRAPAAFELVEILDSDYSGSIQSDLASKSAFYSHLDELPAQDRNRFEEAFSNADIHIEFQDGCTVRRRRQALCSVFTLLLSLPANVVGDLPIPEAPLNSIIRRLSVSRGCFSGPLFDVHTYIRMGDPTVGAIRKNLQNTTKRLIQ